MGKERVRIKMKSKYLYLLELPEQLAPGSGVEACTSHMVGAFLASKTVRNHILATLPIKGLLTISVPETHNALAFANHLMGLALSSFGAEVIGDHRLGYEEYGISESVKQHVVPYSHRVFCAYRPDIENYLSENGFSVRRGSNASVVCLHNLRGKVNKINLLHI